MKKNFMAVFLIMGIAIHSRSQDYAVAANEYCTCYKKLKDSMDTDFQQLIIRVAKSSDLKAAFTKELDSLSNAQRQLLAEQLETLGAVMDSEDTEAGRCGIALDKKYEKYNDTVEKEKEFAMKLANELKKNKNCEFLWAVSVFALAFSEED